MGTTIGDILPLAIAVALSPTRIVAVILMLFGKNARRTSLGFLAGWIVGITFVASVVILVANPVEESTGGDASPLSMVVHLLLGVLLLFLAFREWKKRPRPGDVPEMPKWMSTIDSMTAGKAFGLGALLSVVSPKNIALTVSACVIIATSGLNTSQMIVVLVVFILIACSSVAAPVIIYFILGDKATPTLNDWKEWLVHNNASVVMLLCLVFGVVLIGKGLGALIG